MTTKYIFNEFGDIIDTDSGMQFAPVDGNRDYAVYLDWVAVGNTADPFTVPLADAQAAQVGVLTAACQSAIYAGFTSSALGAAYTYPAKDTDQQNLASSVLASLMPANATGWTTPFWCADANGNWAFVNHTVAQIQQVGIDGKTAILAAMGLGLPLARFASRVPLREISHRIPFARAPLGPG